MNDRTEIIEIEVDAELLEQVNRIIEPMGLTSERLIQLFFEWLTIFYKGIMPSEKVLDFPVDCNTLTGSVNL